MSRQQWREWRFDAGMTQMEAARKLEVSQPYLSQLECGARQAGASLMERAAEVYGFSPTMLPLSDEGGRASGQEMERALAGLGYAGFGHVRGERRNPAAVVYRVVMQREVDARVMTAVPWVLQRYGDLDWGWLRDRAKVGNAQNRLGYLVRLAREAAVLGGKEKRMVKRLRGWETELEEARLAKEGTLCRESMKERERAWWREHRPEGAAHWNLLTGMRAEEVSDAG